MLNETRRQQLDGIVNQMVANKESDSNIQFVVDDFKTKYANEEVPTKSDKSVGFAGTKFLGQSLGVLTEAKPLMQTSKTGSNLQGELDKRLASGKLTKERYDQLSQGLQPDITDALPDRTSGDIVRGGVKAGLDIGSLFIGGGATGGLVKSTVGGLVKLGAVQGAKYGAAGGAISGLGQGIEDNQGVGQTVLKTAGGAIAGGVAGGVMGGALPLAGKAVNRLTPKGRETALANKTQSHALDLVSPKITSNVSEQAIKQGRVTEPRLLGRSKILPSKRDYELADAVEGVVSPKKSILQNTDSIDKRIRQINTGVKEYVRANKVPFNTNQLRSQLNAGRDELKLIFASDTNAEKTYTAVVDEFMQHVGSKDTEGLLLARQEFDKIPAIRKLLESQGLGENVKKEVVLTARGQANKYIANLLPEGNPYRRELLKESRMIEAISNIAEKNKSIIGKNNLQILAQRYPILKWVIGGIATGVAGGAGIGVGSAIIGSTD